MQLAIPLFPGVTALDAVGPYEVLQRMPEVEPVFVGAAVGQVRSDLGALGLHVDTTFDKVPAPKLVVVPGGFEHHVLADATEPLVAWLKRVHPTTLWTTSVCSGALLLAKAGLLEGVVATTHRGARARLGSLGVQVSTKRVEVNKAHRIITTAGVSAGIDMALQLLTLIRDGDALDSRAAQAMVEYFPHPPFQAEDVDSVPATIRNRADALAVTLMTEAGIPL